MVQIQEILEATSKLVNSQPLVAVFVGGTAGIGEYTLRQLVNTHASKGSGLCIYIVGRNAQAANKIISDCTANCPEGKYHFIQVTDLSLMQNVDKAAAEIAQHQQENSPKGQVPRVDMLFMTQGGLYLGPREDTKEGLDFSMAMHFYSRARFVMQLLPLLKASTLPAHTVWVYAAGMEEKLIEDDLSLRKPGNFNMQNARSHCTFLTTAFMQEMAAQNPGKLSLVNVFPGLVITPAFTAPNVPVWVRALWFVASPLARYFAESPEDTGQRMLFLATDRFPAKSDGQPGGSSFGVVAVGTDGQIGSGAYACHKDCATTPADKRAKIYEGFQPEELSKTLWEHTMKAFDAITSGKAFVE